MEVKKTKPTQPELSKQQLIERLMAKAALDYKCCGHGKCNSK